MQQAATNPPGAPIVGSPQNNLAGAKNRMGQQAIKNAALRRAKAMNNQKRGPQIPEQGR